MTQEEQLLNECKKFIKDQQITCADTIYQSDRIIENAYEFIERICNIVGFEHYED